MRLKLGYITFIKSDGIKSIVNKINAVLLNVQFTKEF